MTETTTTQITEAQRDELESRKQQGDYNSLKEVIADLLENGETTVAGIDETEARDIAQDVVADMVVYEALE